jgi:ribosomal protein S18 acetylase RimI-like enzyme
MITRDFDQALLAYKKLYADSPFFETWVPREKFISADFDDLGNLLISREDNGVYGIAIGASPAIPGEWKNFSMESQGIAALPQDFKAVAEWDSYWAPTVAGEYLVEEKSADSVIDEFLKAHAPQSSVFPGNEEVQEWVQIHRNGELAGVAALCKWESGKLVIASVATHSEMRGQGIGKELMRKTLIAGDHHGAEALSLGVMHSNISAQRLYASLGFTLMHHFTYCERR